MNTTGETEPLLDHHFRVPWDEEAGLQLERVWQAGEYDRQHQARRQAQARLDQRREAEGWIGREELEAIVEAELKILGRPSYHAHHLTQCFKRALREHLPKEMFPEEMPPNYALWIIPFPNAGRQATLETLHLIAYRGMRTGSLPKAVQDVIRSRKIQRREGQSRVVTTLAK